MDPSSSEAFGPFMFYALLPIIAIIVFCIIYGLCTQKVDDEEDLAKSRSELTITTIESLS